MKIGAIYLDDICIVPRVWNAVSAWERTRGLLGRPPLQAGEGMLIRDCRLVHTLGMAYALDLAFLDRNGQVKKLVHGVLPTRLSGSLQAQQTLELAPGTLAKITLKKGDVLAWREAGA
ncbi:DUF192 domain-containing protein [Herminiimonas sp.]|uniref:DUF192 domain-containing protein n=1 Tax=Herminiimonas sp. TaxID=1926289 RepID=UPI00271A33E7|nr:DUF192 domain-containing protein [Herminiimonas sp.]MDO8305306.1 DUF192 domain-containing protein [Herminiimonas sp.]